MRLPFKSLCALLFSLVLVAACGQKGPLFLPGDPSSIKTDMPAKQGNPQEDEDKDEDKDDAP